MYVLLELEWSDKGQFTRANLSSARKATCITLTITTTAFNTGQRYLDRPVQDPLHLSCSKRSRKLLIDQVEQLKYERHVKFAAKARVERETSAVERKAVSVDPRGSDPEQIFVFWVKVRVIYSMSSCISWPSGRAPYIIDLLLVCAWGLNLELFVGVSLQRGPASIIF